MQEEYPFIWYFRISHYNKRGAENNEGMYDIRISMRNYCGKVRIVKMYDNRLKNWTEPISNNNLIKEFDGCTYDIINSYFIV